MNKMNLSSSRIKPRIAFVGNFQYNCGSSNTLLGYVQAGKNLGYDIRASEFGYVDDIIRDTVPIAKRDWQPDLLVVVYESYPFLSLADIEQICRHIPRSKRVIIDPDGKYSQPRSSSGDTNHPKLDSYKYWTNLYDSLSDVILQPHLGISDNKKIQQFLYFGVNKNAQNLTRQSKDYDLLYVGNNWYRWQDISRLVKQISPIRKHLKKIGLIGSYWSSDIMSGFEDATYSDPNFLKKNKIEVLGSAPYGQVEIAMSRGLLNPILIRPILNHMSFVTPRMFETFLADTVPLIPQYFTHAIDLYGDNASQLILSNPADDIMQIIENYDKYVILRRNILEMLKEKHSYEIRINQLFKFA
ncbi:MAG: hypothetical protein Q8P26_01740 [Candidatus Levybacteria bacterium]|nr:hypothetical protein [Candidatus Levybacteria bacterium]